MLDAVKQASAGSIPDLPEHLVLELRSRLLRALGDHVSDPCCTRVSAALIRAFCRHSGDPDAMLADWVDDGAPFGIEREIPNPGIFPSAETSASELREEDCATTTPWGWTNYSSAEESPEKVRTIIDKMKDKGWAK